MDEKYAATALIGGVIVISVLAFFLVQGLITSPVSPAPPTTSPPVDIPPIYIPPTTPPTTPPSTDGRVGLIDSTTIPTTPAGPACPSSTQRNVPAHVGSGPAMSLAAQDALTQCQSARTACETQNNIPCTVTYCQSITTLSATQKKQCVFNLTQADFVVGANGIPTKLGSGSCSTIQTSGTVSIRTSGATQPDGWTCGATLKSS